MENPPIVASNPEEIRKANLTHEASVRSIGILYLLGAIFCIIAGIASIFTSGFSIESIVVGLMMIVLGAFQIWVGRKLRQLDPVAKVPATVLSAIGLLGFPLGTLINGYVLYLLHSAKGKVVFSPEYHAVIAATPHIKYKTSLLVWLFLGLLVLLALIGILFAFTAKY